MRMKKVSVIIPVWNPGQGIDRCIVSLRAQTLQEIEMIFIDDQGTDAAMEKVHEAAETDPRIRILINPENIGAGPSRNRGIDAAEGEYLSFIDPDDYIEPEYLEILYNTAASQNLDIAKGSVVYEKEDGRVFVRDRDLNQSIRTGLGKCKPLYTLFTYEHHNALYCRRLIIDSGVRYGSSRRSQDTTFLLQVCSNARKFGFAEAARYHFCERSNSAMHRKDRQMLIGLIDAFKEQADYVIHRLSGDPYACGYLLVSLQGCIRESARFFTQQGDQDHVDHIIDSLREFVSELPYHHRLQEQSFSVRALQEYQVLLPSMIYKSPWENETADAWIELLAQWSDFIAAHPGCVRDGLKEYLYIYHRAWQACQKSGTEGAAKKKAVRLQMKRLPVYLQILCKGCLLVKR